MQSGFEFTGTTGNLFRDALSDDARVAYTTDLHGFLRGMQRENPPGQRWAYKDSDTELLGWVLARATGETIAEQLERQVWRRIGTQHDASWNLDHRGGTERASSGFNSTVYDLARYDRLYLHGGAWSGEQVVPREWVNASITLDTSRTQPEVVTWWRMQHNRLWWIPMHNWAAERDFFADGHKGQRLYVHPPTGTIIVQIADDSQQDFPFRRIAHHLAGQPYKYPRGMVALIRRAMDENGIDSAWVAFRSMSAEEQLHPDRYVVNEAAFLSVANTYRQAPRGVAAGNAVLRMAAEQFPLSCTVQKQLGAAIGPAETGAEDNRTGALTLAQKRNCR